MRARGFSRSTVVVLAALLSAVLAGCGQATSEEQYVSICTEEWPISQSDCQQIIRASRACPDGERNEFLMVAQGSYAVGGFTLGDAIDNAKTMLCSSSGVASATPTTTRSPTTTTTTRSPTTTTQPPTTSVYRWDREARIEFLEDCINVGAGPEANVFCIQVLDNVMTPYVDERNPSADVIDCLTYQFLKASATGQYRNYIDSDESRFLDCLDN